MFTLQSKMLNCDTYSGGSCPKYWGEPQILYPMRVTNFKKKVKVYDQRHTFVY